LIYIADGKPVIVLIRGDDQLNEAKFAGKSGQRFFARQRRKKSIYFWAHIPEISVPLTCNMNIYPEKYSKHF